ncbi:rolling circle replication-associated protein [Paralysiella testudinis]|uniref:Replication endonuclease n=1 Tax=Paralysiella testudinis TaxID=2809020 RepID=A0A892ZJA8_9NEIS|nr:replication endonuclease [Paralysiella testudinis]QRQ81796.1 replication endonuclease [Paralysiella testudinis]
MSALKESLLRNDSAAERLKAAGRKSLPCLNRNISIRPGIDDASAANEAAAGGKVAPVFSSSEVRAKSDKEAELNEFTTAHRKSAYALELNTKALIDRFGIDHVGFMTLTFADHVTCPSEAQRRFNSLRTNFLKHHYKHYIRVVERTKSGRIHYHLLVVCKDNIRRGLNFRQIAARNYKTANEAIKRHWKNLRTAMPKYGFGRSELMPVKTNSKGLARYVAKYIGKHIDSRISADKGVRLCQTSQDKQSKWKIATSNFQFASPGSKLWRQKLKNWIIEVDNYLFERHIIGGYYRSQTDYQFMTQENYSELLTQRLGSKWAYTNRQTIAAMPI